MSTLGPANQAYKDHSDTCPSCGEVDRNRDGRKRFQRCPEGRRLVTAAHKETEADKAAREKNPCMNCNVPLCLTCSFNPEVRRHLSYRHGRPS